MFGLMGKLMSGWRQPAQKTTEQMDIPGQWGVPIRKIFGVFLCGTVALLAFWLLTLTIPPDYVVEGATYIGAIFAVVFALTAFYYCGKDGDHPRAFFLNIVFTAAAAAVTAIWIYQSHGDWWLGRLDPRILNAVRLVTIAALGAGVTGVYWFVKELINPFELTGMDRVLMKIVEDYLPELIAMEMKQAGFDEDTPDVLEAMDSLRSDLTAEIEGAVDGARRAGRITHTDGRTAAVLRQQAHQAWAMDVMGFVLMVEWFGFMSRSQWVDQVDAKEYFVLPSGLRIDQGVHSAMLKQLDELGLVKKTNRGPAIDMSELTPEMAVERIALLDCPPKYTGRYTDGKRNGK